MLATLVPDGRTHRIAPLVAAMLQYALAMADEKRDDDAGVEYRRTNSRGDPYSIVEEAYEEYIRWFDMPWE